MKILNRVLLKEHINKLDYIKIKTFFFNQKIPLKDDNADHGEKKDICNT